MGCFTEGQCSHSAPTRGPNKKMWQEGGQGSQLPTLRAEMWENILKMWKCAEDSAQEAPWFIRVQGCTIFNCTNVCTNKALHRTQVPLSPLPYLTLHPVHLFLPLNCPPLFSLAGPGLASSSPGASVTASIKTRLLGAFNKKT